ncbi:hypothetical protein [Streptomyces afghaniensis 772] [Streptomyces afghaniensis]
MTLLSVRLTGVRIRSTLRYTEGACSCSCGLPAARNEERDRLRPLLRHDLVGQRPRLLRRPGAAPSSRHGQARLRKVNQRLLQLLLFGSLAVVWLVPVDAVLSLPFAARLATAMPPGLHPDLLRQPRPSGTTLGGPDLRVRREALAGGAIEYLALVTGYQALLLVVAACTSAASSPCASRGGIRRLLSPSHRRL